RQTNVKLRNAKRVYVYGILLLRIYTMRRGTKEAGNMRLCAHTAQHTKGGAMVETRRCTQAAGHARREARKDEASPRQALAWLMRGSLVVLVTLGCVAAFAAQASADATVATDHVDYATSQVAWITGSGWTPGEVVALKIEITQAPSTTG